MIFKTDGFRQGAGYGSLREFLRKEACNPYRGKAPEGAASEASPHGAASDASQ